MLLRGRPSTEDERLRLFQTQRASDFESTGLYLPPGGTLEIVSGGTAAPKVWVGDWDSYQKRAPRPYQLRNGVNRVTDAGGGLVYLSLAGAGETASVTFRGGFQRAPHYVLGRTTPEQWRAMLDERPTPWVELVSERTILTLSREAALLYRDEDQGETLRLLDRIVRGHEKVSGLDGSSPLHAPNANRYHLTWVPATRPGVAAYATHHYTAYPPAYMDRLLGVRKLHDNGWGVWHELGHQFQQMAYKPGDLTEVTVNLYSLAAQKANGLPSNLVKPDAKTGLTPYQSALPKLGRAGLDYNKDFGAFEKLVMLQQLTLAYGEEFWPKVHRLVREERPPSEWDETATRWRYLALYTSRVAGHDLSGFYARWGAPLDERARAELAALKLPAPTVDPSTLKEGP
ncbi:hypothetical protein D5H75_15155 [Bailinhaonella thermotolerans]|uniref:Peptidase M60 domain-containing protein n=1 Tax=Bailinhaonella thermotolerans TaxID=1070861 RepID=A0A3A4B3N6_9ACTN|nr:hypothetical protein D5H75_15155 [Bailinhaonella thermotolerans]